MKEGNAYIIKYIYPKLIKLTKMKFLGKKPLIKETIYAFGKLEPGSRISRNNRNYLIEDSISAAPSWANFTWSLRSWRMKGRRGR